MRPIQTPHSLGLSISWGTRSLLRTTLDSTAHSLRNGQQGHAEEQHLDRLTRSCAHRITTPQFSSLARPRACFRWCRLHHRADDDVAATCLVYRVLLAAVANMPAPLVAHIADMADVERWNSVYVFKELASSEAAPYSFFKSRKAQVAEVQADLFGAAELRADQEAELDRAEAPVFAAGIALTQNAQQAECFTGNISNEQQRSNNETPGHQGDAAKLNTPHPSENEEEPRPFVLVPDKEIAQAFDPDGIIGKLYEDYEPREPQKLMALSIQQALRKGENAVIEAGTGVGKSMAYLLPLALLAKANNVPTGVRRKRTPCSISW